MRIRRRRRVVAGLAALAVLTGSCGDAHDTEGAATAEPTVTQPARATEPSTAATVPTAAATTIATVPTTATPPPPTANRSDSDGGTTLAILRADGLGPVGFGTPADEALDQLDALLGQPDRAVELGPDRECVEGSTWADCIAVARAGRIVGWSELGLEVALSDADEAGGVVPLHLATWRAVRASGSTVLTTPDRLRPGMTVGDVRQIDPSAAGSANEGLVDAVVITTAGGRMMGELVWESHEDFVGALQESLNDHGADLAVDGSCGPRTLAALDAFARTVGTTADVGACWLEQTVADGLDFPPPQYTVEALVPAR